LQRPNDGVVTVTPTRRQEPIANANRIGPLLDIDLDLSQHLDELELDESDDDEPVLCWKDGRLVGT